MDVWHDGKYWRIGFVSRIQSKWPRRFALVVSTPIMLAVNMLLWLFLCVGVMVSTPLLLAPRFWPGELFRTAAKRWSVPLPPLSDSARTPDTGDGHE